jgi:integrase
MYEKLLYQNTRKNRSLPGIFTKKDISKILLQLQNSNSYHKKGNLELYGKWLKCRDITLIATIYILSLRPKEACCLKFDDFDFQHSLVHIRGCHNKVKKDRIIPIPKILLNYFKVYFSFPKERFWKGSPYLFPSLQNNYISTKRIRIIF